MLHYSVETTKSPWRLYLSVLFRVAREEKRYKNGEIDGSTEMRFRLKERMPESQVSDNNDAAYPIPEDAAPRIKRVKATPTYATETVHTGATSASFLPVDAPINAFGIHEALVWRAVVNNSTPHQNFTQHYAAQANDQTVVVAREPSSCTLDFAAGFGRARHSSAFDGTSWIEGTNEYYIQDIPSGTCAPSSYTSPTARRSVYVCSNGMSQGYIGATPLVWCAPGQPDISWAVAPLTGDISLDVPY